MKVTTKGQVTIPLEIREQFGIQAGAEVEFGVEGNKITITPRRTAVSRGRRIVDHLRGRGDIPMSTDEIMALTRGEA